MDTFIHFVLLPWNPRQPGHLHAAWSYPCSWGIYMYMGLLPPCYPWPLSCTLITPCGLVLSGHLGYTHQLGSDLTHYLTSWWNQMMERPTRPTRPYFVDVEQGTHTLAGRQGRVIWLCIFLVDLIYFSILLLSPQWESSVFHNFEELYWKFFHQCLLLLIVNACSIFPRYISLRFMSGVVWELASHNAPRQRALPHSTHWLLWKPW